MRDQATLKSAETADVTIVGGGVIGLALARSLALRGVKDVLLIERAARTGAEASSAAGGMLAPQAEADCADSFFQLAAASRDIYPSFAAALLEETGTDVELDRTGTLYLAFTDEDELEIERRYDWQMRAGLAVEILSAEDVRRLEPSVSADVRAALRFPLDVQVENRKLVGALASSVVKHGVRVLTETTARSLVVESGVVRGVETSRGRVESPAVVLAAGAWTSNFAGAADKAVREVRIEPVRGQMLCFRTSAPLSRHVIYSPRGYLIPRMDGRLLAGSTTERAGFEKMVTGRGLHTIMTHALEIAPRVGELPLTDSWAGLRPRAEDELPVMGESMETRGLFYATGHYRNGILLAPLTGELMAELVTTGKTSNALEVFGPDRFQCVGIS